MVFQNYEVVLLGCFLKPLELLSSAPSGKSGFDRLLIRVTQTSRARFYDASIRQNWASQHFTSFSLFFTFFNRFFCFFHFFCFWGFYPLSLLLPAFFHFYLLFSLLPTFFHSCFAFFLFFCFFISVGWLNSGACLRQRTIGWLASFVRDSN